MECLAFFWQLLQSSSKLFKFSRRMLIQRKNFTLSALHAQFKLQICFYKRKLKFKLWIPYLKKVFSKLIVREMKYKRPY